MTHSPLISVVVPAYNTRGTIAETLDSVLAQTFTDYEVVVVDDGSPDDVADFVAQTYPQVRLVRQENRGLAGARNTGLQEARGVFVAFLDSDDVWLPEKLARQAEQIRAHTEAKVFYSDCWFWRDGKRTGRWSELHRHADGAIARQLVQREVMLPVLTVVARREAVLEVGGFDESLREVEDYDLWLRLAVTGSRFVYLDEPTALYRLSAGQMSGNVLKMAQTQLRVYQKLAGVLPVGSELAGEVRAQIKTFRLEVLHQRRRLAAARGDRLATVRETLRMMAVAPERTPRVLVAAVLGLIRPQKYR
jgi:glycosyltransferase involved in cell wall biosynthesis